MTEEMLFNMKPSQERLTCLLSGNAKNKTTSLSNQIKSNFASECNFSRSIDAASLKLTILHSGVIQVAK